MTRSEQISNHLDCLECVLFSSGIKYYRSQAWGIDCNEAQRLERMDESMAWLIYLNLFAENSDCQVSDTLLGSIKDFTRHLCSKKAPKCQTC